MSKLTIIGVIVLMSISLLGVVGLQLYWISDAVRVKQEQFDRSVHEALARVVEKLETQEAVSAVTTGMASLQYSPDEPARDSAIALFIPAADNSAQQNKQPASSVKKNKARNEAESVENSQAVQVQAGKLKKATSISGQVMPIPGHSIEYVRFGQTVSDSLLRSIANGARVQGLSVLPSKQLQRMATTQGIAIDSLRARAIQLSGSRDLRIRHTADSTVSYTRQVNGRTFRISMDTLQYIALHMDSIRHNNQLFRSLKPTEINSISVRKDSIIILKNPTATVMRSTERTGASAGNITYRGVLPAEGRPMQEPQALSHFIIRQTQPETPAKPAPAEKKPTKKQKTQPAVPATPDPAKIEAKKERLNNVVEKMVVEYVSKDVPLENRLNLAELKPLLESELQDKGIALEFGYSVLTGQQDTVVASYMPNTDTRKFATYTASLFPNDIFDKPDHLAVYFPDSQAYALKSLWVMLLFSAGFTLVIMATFATTIHIIFRQKKLSDMKNDFINNMTHEFKTPIATISLATDAIVNPKIYSNPDKIKHYTNIIRQENKRMNVQVENVLQIAQLEKNDYRMNLQPVDLHALICKAVESIRLQVEERMGQVSAQLDALEHELKLDEVHAYNVICNLLDNANKYSPASPDIRLVTQNVEGGVLLAVEDKGMGMTRDTQLRVFDKFYRVPTGNLHNVKGFGLGLSYVKAIVKAHNGNIRLQSEPGKGSRFEIFLPFNA